MNFQLSNNPNLSYIQELSEGDPEFEKNMLNIIKNELIKDLNSLRFANENKNYGESAIIVHKIKHKIKILQMADSLSFTETYEAELKQNKNINQEKFEYIVQTMLNFIRETLKSG